MARDIKTSLLPLKQRVVMLLEDLDWAVINGEPHNIEFEEGKRIRSAEVLVPDSLVLTKVQCIAVNTTPTLRRVDSIIEEYGQYRNILPANCRYDLFIP